MLYALYLMPFIYALTSPQKPESTHGLPQAELLDCFTLSGGPVSLGIGTTFGTPLYQKYFNFGAFLEHHKHIFIAIS